MLRFQHETILEYFAVQALAVDFVRALALQPGDSRLREFRLAQVMLDHFQSSVYGFVDEMLDPIGYRATLVNWISANTLQLAPELLSRNLIEYLGLTVRELDAPEVSRALIALVADDTLTPMLRYTAPGRSSDRTGGAASVLRIRVRLGDNGLLVIHRQAYRQSGRWSVG